MWGQALLTIIGLPLPGIIPTRVGTRSRWLLCLLCNRDHPHACGDKLIFLLTSEHFSGSSPRVWGQAPKVSSAVPTTGIIPTRVGTSRLIVCGDIEYQDHPHACGDKSLCVIFTRQCSGSSPRVWGQVDCVRRVSDGYRIIPTRVGTSTANAPKQRIFQDHPHACGDKLFTGL